MGYETVTPAFAGTSGLPDETAAIYRLENKNLMPDGDFEASTAGAAPNPAYWAPTGTGTHEIRNSGHPLNNNAMFFQETTTDYMTFDLDNLIDTALIYSSYVIRFSLSGDSTGDYQFRIDDAGVGTDFIQYIPSIAVSSQAYNFPEDFDTVPQTEFSINSDTQVFRINSELPGNLFSQTGYIDDVRVVKSDQMQHLQRLLPYTDTGRVDSLELISGWYRFSIWVKADPGAGSNNRFSSDAATLTISALDNDGIGGSSKSLCFSASDYSSFTNWTKIYIDTELQIDAPASSDDNVIQLFICPCCSIGGARGADTGSILISSPSLEYSPTASF
jgi:hypothetical protein